jgi:hypothetical protein
MPWILDHKNLQYLCFGLLGYDAMELGTNVPEEGLKIEAAGSSETFLPIYQSAPRP